MQFYEFVMIWNTSNFDGMHNLFAWILEIKLKSLCLQGKQFTNWTLFPSLNDLTSYWKLLHFFIVEFYTYGCFAYV